VECLEWFDIPGKLVDSRARLQSMGKAHQTLTENLAARRAAWIIRVYMGAHGAGQVT